MIEEQVVSAQECREEIQTVDFGKDAFGWLEVSLSGVGRVVSQSIQPGQRVSKGQTVLLTLK